MHDFDQWAHRLLLHLDDEAIDQARKWRQKIRLGMAMTRTETGVVQGDGSPCASCCGLAPVGDCEPKISIMPTTVPNRPISGLIEAMVPSVVRGSVQLVETRAKNPTPRSTPS